MLRPTKYLATSILNLSASACATTLVAFGVLAAAGPATGAETILLGGAQDFAILAGSTVTNTGPTIVAGNIGVSPGTAITGFPPGIAAGGTFHAGDAAAAQGHADAATAYGQVAGETQTMNLTGQNLGGITLNPGVYHFDNTAQLTGTLQLNTGGNPNAAFHFQVGSTLVAASASSVVLLGLNGVLDPNIFWQIGSSATLGTGAFFEGNILALQSITLTTGAVLDGRALALNGAVTLDTNLVTPIPALPAGRFWKGGASNLWSGLNWSPDATGATSSTLAPAADVVFSVTGALPQRQNTVLDVDATIASLTVSDPAPVTVSGPHVLTITGAGIAITPGAGLTTINSTVLLDGAAQVTVDNAAGLLINGVVGGKAGLIKAGGGVLTLSGHNTYSGLTRVAAGTLDVEGSLAGSALVSGGTLRGLGRIGGNVTSQAAVNPGRADAPGTLQVEGSFTQRFPGSLNIRLASPSNHDLLAIGGAALLGGALNVSSLAGFQEKPGESIPILTAAGGVFGRFASFNDRQATDSLLHLGVVYQKNDVLLEMLQGPFAGLSSTFALTPNERAVAQGLDKLAARQPQNKLIESLDALPLSQLRGALSRLSPEDLSAIFLSGLAISRLQVGNLERRLEEVRQGSTGFSDSGFAVSDAHGAQNYDGKSAVETEEKSGKAFLAPTGEAERRWGFFISGTGDLGDFESTGEARGSSFTTGGVTVGADYRVNRHLVLGAAFGYANTTSDLSRGGRLDIQSGQGSLYATVYEGGFYLNAVAGGGAGSLTTRRKIIDDSARGDTGDAEFNGLLGTGYDFHPGAFTVGPVASVQYGTLGLDGFSEHDALGALRIDSQSQDSLRSAIGLKAAWTKRLGRVVLTPEVRVQWQHEYLTSATSVGAGFDSGSTFTVHGPRIGRDGLLLDLGVSAQLNAAMAIFACYSGELEQENESVQSVSGGLRVSF